MSVSKKFSCWFLAIIRRSLLAIDSPRTLRGSADKLTWAKYTCHVKRFFAPVILVALLGISLSVPAFGAVKAGTSCKKPGAISVSKGKKYTCVRIGNRILWDKGTLLPISKPSSKPLVAPSAIRTTSTSAAPSAKPVDKPPTSFQDIPESYRGIAKAAWDAGSAQIANASPLEFIVNVIVGPNTVPTNPQSLVAISKTISLYSGIPIPQVTHLIKFSQADIEWAKSKYMALQDQTWRNDYLTFIQSHCPDITCNNGNAQVNNSGQVIITIGEYADLNKEQREKTQLNRFNGALEAHEFTHGIQFTTAKNSSYGNMPVWLLEGMATWSEGAVAAKNFEDYQKLRDFRVGELFQNPTTYNFEWINTFLNPNPKLQPGQDNRVYWSKYERFRPYDVGSLAVEALVALKGPTTAMRMFVEVGRGLSFIEAFQKEYGISWADACPIISQAIANELQAGPTSE